MDNTRQRDVRLHVNGEAHTATVETRLSLADLLRNELGLTGTHLGCEHGVCGVCTVLVDGEPVRSCLMLAVQVDGQHVETVEGLTTEEGELHPLQASFSEHHALQCGYCTPGFLMTAVGILRDNPSPSREEVVEGFCGNLCRCTGYAGIVDATLAAAEGGSAGQPSVDGLGQEGS